MHENNCTVLVSSCDSYGDTWYPFFKILKVMWPDRPYPIVLNTESKKFDYEDLNIKTFSFYKSGQKVPWGARLIKTLENIETDYIIFLLDDFFLTEKVQQERIEECITWMESNQSISVFSFWRTHQPNFQDNKYPHFEKRPQDGEYRLNCQAAVWQRKRLIHYIRPHENPWQWEIIGSERSQRYKESFYSAIEGEPYVFTYLIGGGLHGGKWTYDAKKIFEEYNIDIDLTCRGMKGSYKNEKKRSSIYLFLWKGVEKLKNIIIRWKSLR